MTGSQYPPPTCETLANYGSAQRGRPHAVVAADPLAYYEARVDKADEISTGASRTRPQEKPKSSSRPTRRRRARADEVRADECHQQHERGEQRTRGPPVSGSPGTAERDPDPTSPATKIAAADSETTICRRSSASISISASFRRH